MGGTHIPPLIDLAQPEVVHGTLEALSLRLDGNQAGGATATQKRANLATALSWAVSRRYLEPNPIRAVRSTFLQDAFRGALILVAVTLATVQLRRKKIDSTQPAAK